MRRFDIIKIKENGKMEVPDDFAYEIGLLKGAYFLMEINPELNEANVERIAIPGKDLVEVEMITKDRPGVLSRINNIIGIHGANIVFNEGEEIKGTNKAAIVSILEVSGMNIPVDDLRKKLSDLEDVEELYLRHLDKE